MRTCSVIVCALLLSWFQSALAQETTKPIEDVAREACDQQRSLSLIREQLAEANKSDNLEARLRLHVTAADLLWKQRNDLAREWFTTAWDWGKTHFKEHGIEKKQSGRGLVTIGEDMRFVVIRAIARHDQAWAQRLLKETFDEKEKDAQDGTSEKEANSENADSIIQTAAALLDADMAIAVNFARQALKRSSNARGLTRFLHSLANQDQAIADGFAREVITVQTNSLDLLYLSAYVFGSVRPIGPEHRSVGYQVAQNFKQNADLQRFYVQALLRRAQSLVANPSAQVSGIGAYRLPEAAQLTLGLFELEAWLAQFMPALASSVAEARQSLSPLLAAENSNQVQGILQERRPPSGSEFERAVKAAEAAKTPAERDQRYAQALLAGYQTESESELESIAQKINHLATREQLFNWLYFQFAQKAIKNGEIDRAFKLTEKVSVLEQRAYLLYELAVAALEKMQDRQRARESLQAASQVAERAPDNNEKARAYLGIANVYAELDRQAAFEALQAAVKTINQIKTPDVQSSRITTKVEGERFAMYAAFHIKGFDLNEVFRTLGQLDYENALSAASALEDKTLHAAATMALNSYCLSLPPPKPAPAKAAAPIKRN
jgi:hypothetical protein